MIGGGPAGAAAATTLARTGRSVLLVDDRPDATASPGWRVGEGAPPGLDRAVDEVFGDGTFVVADHERSYANRARWGSDAVSVTDFMINPFGPGWHLDRGAFDARLQAAAAAHGVVIERRRVNADVAAPVVIDASGRRASFARRHGARLVALDRLTAVVAVLARRADDADTTTTVEAVESGWWYTAAIPGRRRVVAFLTDGDLLHPQHRTAPGFVAHARATQLIASFVGPLVEDDIERLVVVAASTAHLDRRIGAGWLAAGDAAASFDPLSSQGILAAVLMGRSAADCVDDPAAHDARYAAIIERSLVEQRATYAAEGRWPDAPFWRRRHLGPGWGDRTSTS